MTEVVLFHHVRGLTDGMRAFADELRSAGHPVHTPDLFEGELPASFEEGFGLINKIGKEVLEQRANEVVAALPSDVVYAGSSWGVMSAQRFAQQRPGARGALLYESCLPITGEWALGPWPDGVSVQIHGMDGDPFFAQEGDIDAARDIVAALGPDRAELFVYHGDQHLFIDSSLPSYDADATAEAVQHSKEFLDRLK